MVSFEIKNLSFSYPLGEVKALDNINLKIEKGEFAVICGKSGCGKTTLLRHLKPAITPHGKREGEIFFEGREINSLSQREAVSKIGYVMQSPENQIVTDKVWHELSFGLESLGEEPRRIRLKVAEMASFFGIQQWFSKGVEELSGGQKQLLNLASIMAMQPQVIILDEPTSQLDPIAAADFLAAVKKINSALGVTVIISEHRLEEVIPLADKVIVMDEGRSFSCSPCEAYSVLKKVGNPMAEAMPAPVQIAAGISEHGKIEGYEDKLPLTVRDGRLFLSEYMKDKIPAEKETEEKISPKNLPDAIKVHDLWFRYEKKGADIIKDLNFSVKKGTFHAVLGGNGAGKTTLLSLISGNLKAYRGKITLGEKGDKLKIALLPQNPQTLFVKKTLLEDIEEGIDVKMSREEKEKTAREAAQRVHLQNLLSRHPYDLSGGEQQRAALAKVLLTKPDILLLDEPTKGLDCCFKKEFAEIIKELNFQGVTVIAVSHDIEFCAEYADFCTLLFCGEAVSTAGAREFFTGNSFYTTAANRMSRFVFPYAVTNEEVIRACLASKEKI